jgi:hypothetical protein
MDRSCLDGDEHHFRWMLDRYVCHYNEHRSEGTEAFHFVFA